MSQCSLMHRQPNNEESASGQRSYKHTWDYSSSQDENIHIPAFAARQESCNAEPRTKHFLTEDCKCTTADWLASAQLRRDHHRSLARSLRCIRTESTTRQTEQPFVLAGSRNTLEILEC